MTLLYKGTFQMEEVMNFMCPFPAEQSISLRRNASRPVFISRFKTSLRHSSLLPKVSLHANGTDA